MTNQIPSCNNARFNFFIDGFEVVLLVGDAFYVVSSMFRGHRRQGGALKVLSGTNGISRMDLGARRRR